MPPPFSPGFLLLVGLCFLLSSSQARESHRAHYHSSLLKLRSCQKIIVSISKTSFSVFQELAQQSNHTNILFAPLRISSCLTMLSLGTKSDAHKQIMEGLRLNHTKLPEDVIHRCLHSFFLILDQPSKWSTMVSGMSLFVHNRLKLVKTFLRDIKKLYHTSAISLNFTNNMDATKRINLHIKQKKFMGAEKVLKELDPETDLAVVSYMSFHGKWYSKMMPQRIVKGRFYLDEKTTIKVPMVNRLDMYYLQRVHELSSLVLFLPHLDSAMATFIMPDKGKLQQVEQMLTYHHLQKIQGTFHLRAAKLYFPILSITETYDLESVMSPLGITQVFNNWTDSSGITKDEPLKHSKVIHKAILTFDDKGTRTHRYPFFIGASRRNTPTLKFNKPFLIFIQNEFNNIPMFLGRVMNPKG